MDALGSIAISLFYGGALLIGAVLLLYAIINRLKERKTEDFERRQN